MRATRRRNSIHDPLAASVVIRVVCECLREPLPELIPTSSKDLPRFLDALRHVE